VLASSKLGALEVLRLEATRLTDLAAARLVEPNSLTKLTHLDLSGNELTSAGAVRLAQIAREGLRWLNVSGNRIGVTGERALRERFGARVLVERAAGEQRK
jgi:Leucine-rich repeat (LRR) protein